MHRRKTVCVIGAGVVGCATAFELQRHGHEVILLDADVGPGRGTSFANGAQLSYSYVEPLASPSTLASLPKLLWDQDSPMRFRLRADPAQWRWGLQFLAACTAAKARHGAQELARLAALSRDTLDAWMSETPIEFGFQRNGKLVLCPDPATLSYQAQRVRDQAWGGVAQEVLDRGACVQLEPALATYGGFVGGVWTPSECVGDPHAYCQALTKLVEQRGGTVRLRTLAQRFVMRGKRVHAVATNQGMVEAEAFVLCAGIESPRLALQLGQRLPIYPIKGYSVTLDLKPAAQAPRASVTDLSKKMVLAPLNGQLRVAAMAELVGHDLSIAPARMQAILAAVQAIYPDLCELTDVRPWAGLRPATPSSLPIIGASPVSNVLLNVGHGALGFTLAAGSARRVADWLALEQPHGAAVAASLTSASSA